MEIVEVEYVGNESQRSCSGDPKCDHTILPFVNYEVQQTCKGSSFQDVPGVGPLAPEVLLEYPFYHLSES
jgi:hypothetical protein